MLPILCGCTHSRSTLDMCSALKHLGSCCRAPAAGLLQVQQEREEVCSKPQVDGDLLPPAVWNSVVLSCGSQAVSLWLSRELGWIRQSSAMPFWSLLVGTQGSPQSGLCLILRLRRSLPNSLSTSRLCCVTHWATKATCVPGDSCNQVQLNLDQRGGVIAISSHCSYSA